MTVAELKKELNKYPDNMEVYMGKRKTEFDYGLVNSVFSKHIFLVESLEDESLSTTRVVILDEE